MNLWSFLAEHEQLTRRHLLRLGTAGVAAANLLPRLAPGAELPPELAQAIETLEPYFTSAADFRDVSRGKPLPYSLPDEKKREVGLTRETWKLNIIADPQHPAKLKNPLSKENGTALDFAGLMRLAEKHAVRFPKVMTCLNIGCPLGMGIWEGVPLRELVWLAQPLENLRRVFYYGYHNDDPAQIFQSSLPLARVLEDPFDLPPVIACYKLNGEFLNSERGGPVRLIVPEAYGFKSVKWLSHVVLTNLAHANDTYAGGNNDLDTPLKTFAATLQVPAAAKAGQPIAVTGYAQVGLSGLSKVQIWLTRADADWPSDDKYLANAPWRDATILPPPVAWGGGLPGGKIPVGTLGFDADGRPKHWPMRLTKVHWAALLPGVPPGEYTLRCRTIDEKGFAQPLPNPFRKSGHCAIESKSIAVQA